ncbi:MAG: UvrD-helicase domain-containing protein [Christensenellales bacterium]|jgi:ATP-dependent helicase/nuclease subunit A
MSRIWNDCQQKAIAARNESIVVSAAAGSGKTSVLAERVLNLIEEGEDIERMLIVTFTNLAAAEMRERIYRRLQQASCGSARLAAQAEKCAFADISTIHAFCGRVLRDNFEQAGISPVFTVADEAEIRMLREKAMDICIEHALMDESMKRSAAKFCARGDTQGIKNTVGAIYERVISLKQPEEWLDSARSNFYSDTFVHALFDEYKQMVCEAAQSAALHLKSRSEILSERGFCKEADQSETERIKMMRAVQAITIDNAILPWIAQISLPKIKGAPNREVKTLTNRANKCFTDLDGYSGDFFGKVKAQLQSAAADGEFFIELTRDFMQQYSRAKRQKNVLDHDDLIHFALKALSIPEIARRYQERFTHVFVDEYQDINDVQNAIITKVKRSGNDFLVGDVKQCIYMFRESNPDLLIARCMELAPAGLIEMNQNYRSAPVIIDFINSVMQFMMTEHVGGVAYAGGQRLRAGREGDGCVEIVLASREEDNLKAEGIEIAGYINELLKQGFCYRDIAILRPEVSSTGRRFAKTLSDMGIPVISGFDSVDARFSEIGVFINLLSLIDSPISDTALLSVMRYPHFGFTEPELARIRLGQKEKAQDKSFYLAVHAYSEDSQLGKKVSAFLSEIEYYRELAQCLTLPDFLMRLRHEAEFKEYALTSPGGKGSDDAIDGFISTVSSIKGIQLRGVLDIADKISVAKQQQKPGERDAVYLTTFHKAKGLEFPVVILSGMHKTINQRDASGAVLIGRKLGLALDTLNKDTHVRQQTLHRQAVARQMRRETISETVRLLYVGMTRAVKRLAIFGAGTKIKEGWLEEKHALWQHEATTYFDLIMPAVNMACANSDLNLEDFVRVEEETPVCMQKTDRVQRLSALFDQAKGAATEDVFVEYAFNKDLGVPSKVSVTALKKRESPRWIKPAFLPSGNEGISAAEKGIMTHRILQKIGLEISSAAEVKKYVHQMIAEGVIEANTEKYINAEKIAGFLSSDLARRARQSVRCLFEAPFCLNISAKELSLVESDENVAVQGVIDMCFVEDSQWVIVDYKTDRVDKNMAIAAAQEYQMQLLLYGKALERITGMKVKEKYIYFININEKVLMP